MAATAWQIPLSVQQPEIETPLDARRKAMSLNQLGQASAIQRQQMQLNEERIKEERLKAQIAQEDQNDQDTIRELFTKHAGNYEKVRAEAGGKLRLRNLQALDTDHMNFMKGLTQMQTEKRQAILNKNTAIGNELLGLLQTPQEQRQAAYLGARARLIQSGDVTADEYPDNAPLDDQTLKAHLAQVGYAAQVAKLADTAAQEAQRKESAERAAAQARKADAEVAAKENQQRLEEAARNHIAVTNQTEHDEWFNSLPADLKQKWGSLKKFNEQTQDKIQTMALSAEQRAVKIDRDIKAKADAQRAAMAGGKAGLASRATDPTLTPEERKAAKDALDLLEKNEGRQTANAIAVQNRFNQREYDRAVDTHKDLEKQIREQTRLADQYTDAAMTKIGENAIDPKTGKEVEIKENQRAYFFRQAQAARQAAEQSQKEQDALHKRFNWGQYTPGAAPAPQPNPPPPGPNRPPVGAPQQAAPAAPKPAATPAASKKATMAQVQAYATQNKVSVQIAKQAVKAQGYTITDEK